MKYIMIDVKNNVRAHFWHFMMGEFLPIVFIIARFKPKVTILYNRHRKWDSIFDKFYKELNTKIIYTNTPNKLPKINYKKWDYRWNKIEQFKCKFAINYLKKLAKKKYGIKNNKKICLYRDSNEKINEFNNKNFGAGKRKFMDLDKLDNYFGELKHINCDGQPILKQISNFMNCNRMILEHGAGMVFCLFLNNHTKIIEIITPEKNSRKNDGAVQGLIRICKLNRYGLRRIIIPNKTSILQAENKLKNLQKNFF